MGEIEMFSPGKRGKHHQFSQTSQLLKPERVGAGDGLNLSLDPDHQRCALNSSSVRIQSSLVADLATLVCNCGASFGQRETAGGQCPLGPVTLCHSLSRWWSESTPPTRYRNQGFPGPCPVADKEEEPYGSPLKDMSRLGGFFAPLSRGFPMLAQPSILPTTFCGQGRRPA